jgi:hypothetical protein
MLTVKDYERFCESEYEFTKNTINRNFYTPKEVVDNAVQRILGVGMFVQQMGIAYEEVDGVFEMYKEKFQIIYLETLDK